MSQEHINRMYPRTFGVDLGKEAMHYFYDKTTGKHIAHAPRDPKDLPRIRINATPNGGYIVDKAGKGEMYESENAGAFSSLHDLIEHLPIILGEFKTHISMEAHEREMEELVRSRQWTEKAVGLPMQGVINDETDGCAMKPDPDCVAVAADTADHTEPDNRLEKAIAAYNAVLGSTRYENTRCAEEAFNAVLYGADFNVPGEDGDDEADDTELGMLMDMLIEPLTTKDRYLLLHAARSILESEGEDEDSQDVAPDEGEG